MNKLGDTRLIKIEKVDINADYVDLFAALKDKPALLDDRVVKQMAKNIGFQTSDEKVYKLISLYMEISIDDVLTSINHKQRYELDDIHYRFRQADDNGSKLRRSTEEKIPLIS